MAQFTVSRTLPQPPAEVWATLADFGGISRWAAGIESSPINPGAPERGLGAERYCTLYDGNHLQERIVEFTDGESMTIDVFETSMPLKTSRFRFDVEAASAGTTLSVTGAYDVKFGLVGKVMDSLVMKKMMGKNFAGLLASLEHHLATGEEIGQGWKPAVDA